MDLNLTTQTALVTAFSAGVGLTIATALAREGATVVVNGRTEESARRGINQISRECPEAMLQKGYGRVLFISSESAISPAPEMAHYSATKTEDVGTFIEQVFPGVDADVAGRRSMAGNRPTSPLQRLIRPEELASFVTCLASPLSAAVNGAALRADGGLVRSIV